MTKFTSEELKNKTPEELAILGERNHPNSAEGILIKNELQRRLISPSTERKKQWYEKPLGLVLLMVAAGLIVGYLIYFLGLH